MTLLHARDASLTHIKDGRVIESGMSSTNTSCSSTWALSASLCRLCLAQYPGESNAYEEEL